MVIIPFKTVVRCFAIVLIVGFAESLVYIRSMPSAKSYAETNICKPTPVRSTGTLESEEVSKGVISETSRIGLNELNKGKQNE